MLKYTSSSVQHHTNAYTGIKAQVENMNKDAASALGRISKHNEDVKRLLAESEHQSRTNQTKVAILEDDDEDEDEERDKGISMANERVLDVSLQKQKEDIVGKLMSMNSNIRTFSSNVEERLQRAYRAGDYAKKFGYEGLNTRNMDEASESEQARRSSTSTYEKLLYKDNKKLNRLQT